MTPFEHLKAKSEHAKSIDADAVRVDIEELASVLNELEILRTEQKSKYCVYIGRDCQILPSAEKEIWDEAYKQGRADAIEEFVAFINTMPTVEEDDGYIRPMTVEEIAEQLKERNNGEEIN